MEEQVAVIFAGVNGYTDDVDTSQITRFEKQYLDTIRDKGQDILASIREDKAISDDTEGKLKAFLDDFMKTFA